MRRALSVAPKLSGAEIAFRIKRLHEDGEALNIAAVREKHPELLLAAYSQRSFLGWRRALELAGLDYSKIKTRLLKYVTCEECGRRLTTLSGHIGKIHNMAIAEYCRLHPNAATSAPAYDAKCFRTTVCALPHWEPQWTPEYVLDRVYQFHVNKIPLSSRKLVKLDQMTLTRGRRYFQKWETVLKMVGLDPARYVMARSRLQWTRNEVQQAILARYKEGQDVSRSGMAKHDSRIVWAALRQFGTYDQAIHACGLESAKIRKFPKPPNKYRTETHVTDEICRRRFLGRPIHDAALRIGAGKDLALWNKGRRLFGTWRAAVEAAGFTYPKITPRTPKYPAPDDVVLAIQLRQKQKLPLTARGVRKGEHKDPNLYKQGCRHFKGWVGTLKAAGIRHKDVVPLRGQYPTRESVLAELQRRKKCGLPLDMAGIRRSESRDAALYPDALKYFGSWFGALSAAGVSVPGVRNWMTKYPSTQSVVAAIRKRRRLGWPLLSTSVIGGKHADPVLYHAALRFFGRWAKANNQAGVDYVTVRAQEIAAKKSDRPSSVLQ